MHLGKSPSGRALAQRNLCPPHRDAQLSRAEFAIRLQMTQENTGDLVILEEAVADDVPIALLFAIFD
jgi:hypothetical protein